MPYEKTKNKEVGRPQNEQGYRPSTAPKWDVLQLERLKNLEAIDLDYRTQPVLVRKERHFVIYIIGLTGCLSLVLSVICYLAGSHLNTAYMFSVFTITGVVTAINKFITQRVKWVALAYVLLGPGLWILATFPQTTDRYPAVGNLAFLASLGLTCYLAQIIATHYAMWLAASPQLLGDKRREAQSLCGKLPYQGFMVVAVYGVLLVIFASNPILGFKNFFWITLFFAVGIFYWATREGGRKETLRLMREAIVSWYTYARYQAVHFDFVEQENHDGEAPNGFAMFFVVVFYGILIFTSLHGFSVTPPVSGEIWATIMSFVMPIFFIMVANGVFWAFYNAYDRNGTVFQNPISVPGLFKSPGGTWIRRNVLAASILFALFSTTIHFIAYAPSWLLFDSRPMLVAFSPVAENEISFTSIVARLEGYKPLTVAEVVASLSTNEAVILQRLDPVAQKRYVLSKQATHYLGSNPGAWFSLMLDSAFMGQSTAVWAILLSIVQCLAFPVVIFLMICFAVFGRVLPRYAKAVEALKSPVTDWQGYVSRLQHSKNPVAREHLWLGVHATEDYPILLHRGILGEHAHLLGDSGSGKTALGMAPMLAQLISAEDSAVVILDLKGDMPLFQTAQAGAGSRFKFFTNEVERATHAFNPFTSLASEHISLNQVCEVFLSALGLEHGEGYGRSYYSRVARNLLAKTIHEYPDIASFEELRDKVGKFTSSSSDEKDAFELIAVVESLAGVPQINHTAKDQVLDNAIDMVQVLKNREVVYFWLPAAIETASVREIAKLALYTLFTSAYQSQREQSNSPRVWVFIDEFQHVASLNFKLLLQQARSMSMGMILANQTDSDLWTKEADLKGTVQSNTRFKQIFAISNYEERESLSKASGETLYYTNRFDADGEVTSMHEHVGPRLMANDIISLSDEKDTSIAIIGRGEGYSQFGGYAFAVRCDYHITKEEYERRKGAAWPTSNANTLTAHRKRMTEVGPEVENKPLSAVYILVEGEPPPEVSTKVTESSWAKHLQALYQAQQGVVATATIQTP